MSKKYNYEDDFEMVYLRHDYIEKCKSLNPEYVKEFAGIVHTTAKIMYGRLYPNFNKVGFQEEDVVSITNMYMLSYMELYSVRINKELKKRYCNKYKARTGKYPTPGKIKNFDRNSLINFLRQRLTHLSTVCARKARNITVGRDRRGAFAFTEHTVEAPDEVILNDYKKYGYRKVTKAELEEARQRAKENGDLEIFDKDGYKIVEIEMLNQGISQNDYKLFIFENKSPYFQNPETVAIYEEEQDELEHFKQRFYNMPDDQKVKKIERFIRENKGDRSLKKELSFARKVLPKIKTMVKTKKELKDIGLSNN